MNKWQSIIHNVFTNRLILLFLLGFGLWFGYKQYVRQQQLQSLVEKLKTEVNAPQMKPTCPAVDDRPPVRGWSDLQALTKNTVVQVFSHVTQFDWLEPYKTPAQGQVSGSAFFINEQGELITNAHVVNQAKAIFIQIPAMGKRRIEVDLVGICPDRDLALLRLKPEELVEVKKELKKIPTLSFGDSDKLSRAEEIMTLGYPLGQQSLKSTTGVVSGREHMNGQYMIQISAPINPGNSGGPSLNSCGQVIGVNTAGFAAAAAQNVNYIIPSNEVQLFLTQLSRLPDIGKIKFLRRPILGLIYNNANDDLAKFLGNPLPSGMYVVEAASGSPLQKVGLLAGDMVYEIDGHRLDEFGDMNVPWSEDRVAITDYISRLMLQDTVHLKVYRAGKALDFSFKLDQAEPTPIRRMFPDYESIDYEILGGFVFMQVSLNNVQLLIQVAPELARFADPKNQLEPALIITHVMPDSAATRARSVGMGAVLQEVNGEPVKTLADLRNAIKKSIKTDMVTLKTAENTFAAFPLRKMLADEKKLSSNYFYKITDFIQSLIRETGLDK
jgi:serine protease Do